MKQHEIHNRFFRIKKSSRLCFAVKTNTDYRLNVTGLEYIFVANTNKLPLNWTKRKRLYLDKSKLKSIEVLPANFLASPYFPGADSCTILDTIVPDSMDYEIHSAVEKIKEEVGGSLEKFVMDRLNYTREDLCRSLAAEQVDAVAMAIYNIEYRNQAIIIGDQTGIGKGRVAASVIRYAYYQGFKPIFLTEKPNLFSDLYRDLVDTGSDFLRPFIINSDDSKSKIKDKNGKVVFEALQKNEQIKIFDEKEIPEKFDYVVATYSQFSSPEKNFLKPEFLRSIAKNNIVVMDESHNASGMSQVGVFLKEVIKQTKGVVFLSATFAKRPDNMPIYAMKTAMSEANMDSSQLVNAIIHGGVALQEVIASQLVEIGQMIRRERSFEGVEVNYITMDKEGESKYGIPDMEQAHKAIVNNITEVLRDIIDFQKTHVDEEIEKMDAEASKINFEVTARGGTSELGVSNQPYFSKIFNVVNQMLFSIKAEAVAHRAIKRLEEGKKPIIAFASTMGSFLEQMEDEKGKPVKNGDTVRADFSIVLEKGLKTVMKYTEKDVSGEAKYKSLLVDELSPLGFSEYLKIEDRIKNITTGISISPIDVIRQIIENAGYKVAEVTGRKMELQLNLKNNMGLVLNRKKQNVNDAFRKFNDNQVDVLLINQSGSTGASAHAIVTEKVPLEKVKQRVMIIIQPELNINTEVQKRGRINRTGQVYKPIYDYMTSAIPAEKRIMMMLQKKLKSLDANTTSNQKQSKKILNVDDFLNVYGDHVVLEYLKENAEFNQQLNDPCNLYDSTKKVIKEDVASKVAGRVAVLSSEEQQKFYDEILRDYDKYIKYLQQIDQYDLEVVELNLQAETIEQHVAVVGKGGESAFGDNSTIEDVEVNILRKPYQKIELENIINDSLDGKTAQEIQHEILKQYEQFLFEHFENYKKNTEQLFKTHLSLIRKEKGYKKKKNAEERQEYIKQRENELEAWVAEKIKNEKERLRKKSRYLKPILSDFKIGMGIYIPYDSYGGKKGLVKSVFLGFKIDHRKVNPYAPSAIDLRFALASSQKYFEIPASYFNNINAIKEANKSIPESKSASIFRDWESLIKKHTAERERRYIVTGNLLQAVGKYPGKLVSYTLLNGSVKKGILLPYNYELKEAISVTVPIIYTLKIIRSMGIGSMLTTNNNVSLVKMSHHFQIIVPASKIQGGHFYTDKDILKLLIQQEGFNKKSNTMTANVTPENISKLVQILNDKHQTNINLSPPQYELIKDELPERKVKRAKPIPRLVDLEAQLLRFEKREQLSGYHPKIKVL